MKISNFKFLRQRRISLWLKISNLEGGQVVLLLVLITIVGLTIGLSLISRTVTDVRISSQIEQSGRAFKAAESGVETALKNINVGVINPTGSISMSGTGASANYAVTSLGNNGNVFTYPLTEKNVTQTVWFVNHDPSTRNLLIPGASPYPVPGNASYDICWGSDPNSVPAVEISLFYISSGAYKLSKLAFDSDASRGNGFLIPESAGNYCNGNFHFKKTLSISDFGIPPSPEPILLALRIQPLYNNSILAVKPTGFTLPSQGELITSVGQTTTGVARKVQVINGYKTLPSIFDYSLFSENEN